eukprot:symbB.v1.2.018470.t3/scaffold1468.1/size117071/6
MVACSPGFMDFFEFRMDLPFFTDTAPDASLAAEAIPKRPGDSHELKAVPSPVEEALPNKEAVEEDPEMPPVEPLAFTVIPSTAEPVKVASEVALVAASGQEEVAQGIRIFVGDSSGFVSMAKVGQMEVQLLRSPGGKVVFLETGPDFVELMIKMMNTPLAALLASSSPMSGKDAEDDTHPWLSLQKSLASLGASSFLNGAPSKATPAEFSIPQVINQCTNVQNKHALSNRASQGLVLKDNSKFMVTDNLQIFESSTIKAMELMKEHVDDFRGIQTATVAQGIRIFVGDSSGFVSMAKVGQMEVQLLRSSGGKVVFLETGPDFVELMIKMMNTPLAAVLASSCPKSGKDAEDNKHPWLSLQKSLASLGASSFLNGAPSKATPAEFSIPQVINQCKVQEMTHENLDRFYRETEAKRPEPKFFLQRYYEGDRTDSSALRTDDGYLTKLGSRLFCMVCFATGHRAQSCPESRCWICFSTGHNVKQCPRTKEKCPMCWRKGHGGDPSETCPFATLKEASRQRNQWSHVRCAACGERGHPMCDGSGKPLLGSRDDLEPPGPRKDETEKARSFADALRGGGSWSNAGRSNWDEQKWHQESWHGSNWKWQNWKEDQWRDHWRNGHNASNGSRSPRHHSQGYQRYGNNSSQHRGGVPSMRIRDAPSARSVQRAAERLKRKLR